MFKSLHRTVVLLAISAIAACSSASTPSVTPSPLPSGAGLTQQAFVGVGDSLTFGEQSDGQLGVLTTSPVSGLPGGVVPPGQTMGFWALMYAQMNGIVVDPALGVWNTDTRFGAPATSPLPLINAPGLGETARRFGNESAVRRDTFRVRSIQSSGILTHALAADTRQSGGSHRGFGRAGHHDARGAGNDGALDGAAQRARLRLCHSAGRYYFRRPAIARFRRERTILRRSRAISGYVGTRQSHRARRSGFAQSETDDGLAGRKRRAQIHLLSRAVAHHGFAGANGNRSNDDRDDPGEGRLQSRRGQPTGYFGQPVDRRTAGSAVLSANQASRQI